MARPKKAVVDYFPHSVTHGKTMFTFESVYGNDGYAFWFKLLELLGAAEHHYLDADDKVTWRFLLAKTSLSETKANEMLNLLSELGSIDNELWQKKIIRSNNFIDNLNDVYSRRGVDVISNVEVECLCRQKLPVNGVSANIKPHSIVKETKGKEIYCEIQKLSLSNIEYEKLIKTYSKTLVDDKIEHAKNYKTLGKKYTSLYLTLNNWLKKDKDKKEKATDKKFDQREYEEKDIEDLYWDPTKEAK